MVNCVGNRTSLAHDANGQQVAVQDANGHRSTTVYDAAAPRGYPAVAAVNALGNRTTTMFDAVGNTQALIDARGQNPGISENPRVLRYDAAEREIALFDPLSRRAGCASGGSSLPGRRTTSGYDAAGNQTLRIDARGQNPGIFGNPWVLSDAASQLAQRRYPDGSRVTFAWDSVGNRTVMADATSRYTWTYDAVNRTTRNQAAPRSPLKFATRVGTIVYIIVLSTAKQGLSNAESS